MDLRKIFISVFFLLVACPVVFAYVKCPCPGPCCPMIIHDTAKKQKTPVRFAEMGTYLYPYANKAQLEKIANKELLSHIVK